MTYHFVDEPPNGGPYLHVFKVCDVSDNLTLLEHFHSKHQLVSSRLQRLFNCKLCDFERATTNNVNIKDNPVDEALETELLDDIIDDNL